MERDREMPFTDDVHEALAIWIYFSGPELEERYLKGARFTELDDEIDITNGTLSDVYRGETVRGSEFLEFVDRYLKDKYGNE